ncbi:MAG TPA: STAS domain-containing protein [Acidobacteriaceae bacterium]|nr:STAS domain-containing protein [Acidobacteriaceae bacterium]
MILVELNGRLAYGDELQGLKAQLASSAGERDLLLILDLSKVEYADSSGLGVLLYLDGVAQEAGSKLRLAGVTGRLLELFQMTHTDKVLTMDRDVAGSLSHSAF